MPWVMRAPGRVVAQITDGYAAWDEFVSGVTRTFESNSSASVVIGAGLGLLGLVWVNYRVARWLANRPGKSGRAGQKR